MLDVACPVMVQEINAWCCCLPSNGAGDLAAAPAPASVGDAVHALSDCGAASGGGPVLSVLRQLGEHQGRGVAQL